MLWSTVAGSQLGLREISQKWDVICRELGNDNIVSGRRQATSEEEVVSSAGRGQGGRGGRRDGKNWQEPGYSMP